MVRIHQTRVPMWVHQDDATLDQDDPVSGTKYTVLDTVKNARIKSVTVAVTWTVQPTPLEVHVTIDGNVIIHIFTDPVSADVYGLGRTVDSDHAAETAQLLVVAYPPNMPSIHYEGKSIKIEAETTGGTVQNISARVKYALRR